MMKSGKTVLALAWALTQAGLFACALSACEKRQAAGEAGPAEQAGRQIDQAASQAGEQLDKFAGKAGQAMQQAGRKLQDETAQQRADRKKEE